MPTPDQQQPGKIPFHGAKSPDALLPRPPILMDKPELGDPKGSSLPRTPTLGVNAAVPEPESTSQAQGEVPAGNASSPLPSIPVGEDGPQIIFSPADIPGRPIRAMAGDDGAPSSPDVPDTGEHAEQITSEEEQGMRLDKDNTQQDDVSLPRGDDHQARSGVSTAETAYSQASGTEEVDVVPDEVGTQEDSGARIAPEEPKGDQVEVEVLSPVERLMQFQAEVTADEDERSAEDRLQWVDEAVDSLAASMPYTPPTPETVIEKLRGSLNGGMHIHLFPTVSGTEAQLISLSQDIGSTTSPSYRNFVIPHFLHTLYDGADAIEEDLFPQGEFNVWRSLHVIEESVIEGRSDVQAAYDVLHGAQAAMYSPGFFFLLDTVSFINAADEQSDYVRQLSLSTEAVADLAAKWNLTNSFIEILAPSLRRERNQPKLTYDQSSPNLFLIHDLLVDVQTRILQTELRDVQQLLLRDFDYKSPITSPEELVRQIPPDEFIARVAEITDINQKLTAAGEELVLIADSDPESTAVVIDNYGDGGTYITESSHVEEMLYKGLIGKLQKFVLSRFSESMSPEAFTAQMEAFSRFGEAIVNTLPQDVREKLQTALFTSELTDPAVALVTLLTARVLGVEDVYRVHIAEQQQSIAGLEDAGLELSAVDDVIALSAHPEQLTDYLAEQDAERIAQLVEFTLTIKGYQWKDDDERYYGFYDIPFNHIPISIADMFTALSSHPDPGKRAAFRNTLRQFNEHFGEDNEEREIKRAYMPELQEWYGSDETMTDPTLVTFVLQTFKNTKMYIKEKNAVYSRIKDHYTARLGRASFFDEFEEIYELLIQLDTSRYTRGQNWEYTRDTLQTLKAAIDTHPDKEPEILEAYAILKNGSIAFTSERLNVCLREEFVQIRDRVQALEIPETEKTNLVLDALYYMENNMTDKLSVFKDFIHEGHSRGFVILRRVSNEDVREIRESADVHTDPLFEQIEGTARQNMQRFFTDYANYPLRYWENLMENYQLYRVTTKLLTSLSIPVRTIDSEIDGMLIQVPVPTGLSKARRATGGEPGEYFPSMAYFLYEQVTEKFSAYGIEKVMQDMQKEDIFVSEGQFVPQSEGKRGNEDMLIAKELWQFVTETITQNPDARYLLWLNESSAPRAFGRDQVDSSFARRLGIAQDIDDQAALRYLGRNRKMLREIGQKVKDNGILTEEEQRWIEAVKGLFNINKSTRVLPLHEVKVPSMMGDGDMEKISPVIDDIIDAAEIFDMDIIFVDIASLWNIGRAQSYINDFMRKRGITTHVAGKRLSEHGEELVWDSNTNFRRVFTHFDPNWRSRAHPSFDDFIYGTRRDSVGEDGIYLHTTESRMGVLRHGGFATAEELLRSAIVTPVVNELKRGLRY